jgi:MFS family permease
MYTFLYAMMGLYFPFIPLFFADLDYTKQRIGMLTMIPNVAAFFVAPFFTIIGDKLNMHLELMVLALIVSTVATCLMLAAQSYQAMLLFVTIAAFFRAPLTSQLDNLVMGSISDKLQFGSFRLWGAVSFGLLSFAGGGIIAYTGVSTHPQYTFMLILFLYAFFAIATGLVLLTLIYDQNSNLRAILYQHRDKECVVQDATKSRAIWMQYGQQPRSSGHGDCTEPTHSAGSTAKEAGKGQGQANYVAQESRGYGQGQGQREVSQGWGKTPLPESGHTSPTTSCDEFYYSDDDDDHSDEDMDGIEAGIRALNNVYSGVNSGPDKRWTIANTALQSYNNSDGIAAFQLAATSEYELQQRKRESKPSSSIKTYPDPLTPPPASSTGEVSVLRSVCGVLLSNPLVVIFCVVVLLSGVGSGVIESFLIIRLRQLGGNGLVMGLARLVTCAAEVPMFHVAGKLHKRFGTWAVLAVTQVAYVARFVYYSHLTDPWAVLPCEVLHGLTFATTWTVSAIYANEIAPAGCHGTMQAILEGLHFGFGSGVGALLGGIGYDLYGAVVLFQLSACLSLVSTVLALLAWCHSSYSPAPFSAPSLFSHSRCKSSSVPSSRDTGDLGGPSRPVSITRLKLPAPVFVSLRGPIPHLLPLPGEAIDAVLLSSVPSPLCRPPPPPSTIALARPASSSCSSSNSGSSSSSSEGSSGGVSGKRGIAFMANVSVMKRGFVPLPQIDTS